MDTLWDKYDTLMIFLGVIAVATPLADIALFGGKAIVRPVSEKWRVWRCKRAHAYLRKHDPRYRRAMAATEPERADELPSGIFVGVGE